jgi:hypothetical protein
MGFFKNMKALTDQAKEIERSQPPVKERMAAATDRMAAMTQVLAQSTAAANAAAGGAAPDGFPVSATITGWQQRGAVGFDPLMQFEVTVMADGRPPYPATVTQPITQMQMVALRAGSTVPGRVNPSEPNGVWLDMSGL